jgi:hypothetical protein
MWESHAEFSNSLLESWQKENEAMTLWELQNKLKKVSSHLVRWDRSTFGHVHGELRRLKQELERQQSDPHRISPTHVEIKIKEKILELNHREEIMWRQRSRILWLSSGDKNTIYFHIRASRRRRRNRITRLQKADGQVMENVQEMSDLTTSFYQELYTSEGTNNLEAVLSTVPTKVTATMNNCLIAAFSEKEVKEALFQMFPTKSPGLDGFPAQFFQRHWVLCGTQVTSIILRILRGEEDATSINDTFIVLIPKVVDPEELGQFRPISLCNVLYKIVSKVVANRLKQIFFFLRNTVGEIPTV